MIRAFFSPLEPDAGRPTRPRRPLRRRTIDRVFEFAQTPEAFDLMGDGDYLGKIVVHLR